MENAIGEQTLIEIEEVGKKKYERPLVLAYNMIRFETAQSWNKGHGNTKHPGTGNDGINYPLPEYEGPRPKPWF